MYWCCSSPHASDHLHTCACRVSPWPLHTDTGRKSGWVPVWWVRMDPDPLSLLFGIITSFIIWSIRVHTVVKRSIYFVPDVQAEPAMRKRRSSHLQKSVLILASQGSIPGWRNFSFFLHLEFSTFWMSPVAYYALITIKLTLHVRSTHHGLMPWHFWSKLNKDRNPSSLLKNGAGMKIRK